MRLNELPLGERGTVAEHDPAHARLFGAMGLREGTVVTVVQRAAFGGRVIGIGADRLALDAKACQAIGVTTLTGDSRA